MSFLLPAGLTPAGGGEVAKLIRSADWRPVWRDRRNSELEELIRGAGEDVAGDPGRPPPVELAERGSCRRSC